MQSVEQSRAAPLGTHLDGGAATRWPAGLRADDVRGGRKRREVAVCRERGGANSLDTDAAMAGVLCSAREPKRIRASLGVPIPAGIPDFSLG